MQNKVLLASVFCYAAQFHQKQGKFKAASALYRRALKELEKHGCADSAHAGLALLDLSECLEKCGQHESSHQTFADAVVIMKTNAARFLETRSIQALN